MTGAEGFHREEIPPSGMLAEMYLHRKGNRGGRHDSGTGRGDKESVRTYREMEIERLRRQREGGGQQQQDHGRQREQQN